MSAALRELHREAGVEHVARRHALMHEARFRADNFGDPGQEGDDVVLGDSRSISSMRVNVEGSVRRPFSQIRSAASWGIIAELGHERDGQHGPRSRTRCEIGSGHPRW
ncbi:hypothetical protein [Hyphomicrobium sp. D-2]|uniref:hypothetical protein n=1 Tax=Hyphomicrobium sp. D-2 TaxID=3041621 RepID=UPI0024561A8E|nr:hypothetical protein [Hyphomicrobium sp. D-2]MDH4981795.1 hypothetical protein [Hyphomicrobium sp. D-2]